MPCGHNDVWMYRVRDKGLVYRYCFKCVFDKLGLKDVFSKPTSIETGVKPKLDETLKVGSEPIIKKAKKKK